MTDNIEQVQESIREDEETSTRRRSTKPGLSRRSLQKICRQHELINATYFRQKL